MKSRLLVLGFLSLVLGLFCAAGVQAAESSLVFDRQVTWPQDDGTLAAAMLRRIPNETGKVEFWVAKPGNPPTLYVHILYLSSLPIPPGPTPPPVPPGPTPPPVPPPVPPTPPKPTEVLKKVVVDAAAKLPAVVRADAPAMSTIYAEVAKAIPAPLDSVEKLITATKMARQMALGPARSDVWDPWVKEVGTWLDANKAAFPEMAAWRDAWVAISDALKGVK